MVILQNKKHVFWQAFFVTLIIFVSGLLIGIAVESIRVDKINNYYSESELALTDILALNNLLDSGNLTCDELMDLNTEFADRIYTEALKLEEYENADRLTDGIEVLHKRYDLLRTLLWANTVKMQDRCGSNFNVVVYLYALNSDDLDQKAVQNVWSKLLMDLKAAHPNNFILIPLSGDGDFISTRGLIKKYNIEKLPAVVINNKKVVYELTTVEELENYIDSNLKAGSVLKLN